MNVILDADVPLTEHRLSARPGVNALNHKLKRLLCAKKLISQVAGVRIRKAYVHGSQGVRGRTSDNSLIHASLDWEAEISLEQGLAVTYAWVEKQVRKAMLAAVGT